MRNAPSKGLTVRPFSSPYKLKNTDHHVLQIFLVATVKSALFGELERRQGSEPQTFYILNNMRTRLSRASKRLFSNIYLFERIQNTGSQCILKLFQPKLSQVRNENITAHYIF